MARGSVEIESAGGHSLTGVVVNVVGLLIIVVTLVGSRVGRSAWEPTPESIDLAATRQAAQTLEGDVNRMAAETNTVRTEAVMRRAERDQLATLLTAAEQDLAARRAALDGDSRQQYDLEHSSCTSPRPICSAWTRGAKRPPRRRTRRSKSKTFPPP